MAPRVGPLVTGPTARAWATPTPTRSSRGGAGVGTAFSLPSILPHTWFVSVNTEKPQGIFSNRSQRLPEMKSWLSPWPLLRALISPAPPCNMQHKPVKILDLAGYTPPPLLTGCVTLGRSFQDSVFSPEDTSYSLRLTWRIKLGKYLGHKCSVNSSVSFF